MSPTRTCLTLSDWVCVFWRAAWRAVRSGEEGGEEGALKKDVNSGTSDRMAATYILSSSSRRLMAS